MLYLLAISDFPSVIVLSIGDGQVLSFIDGVAVKLARVGESCDAGLYPLVVAENAVIVPAGLCAECLIYSLEYSKQFSGSRKGLPGSLNRIGGSMIPS
jgi:hypothetical protein